MGTSHSSEDAAVALLGKVRRAILGLLYSHVDESFYLRQIIRLTAAGQGAVQRELGSLVAAELIVRTQDGRQVYYQANRDSPLFADLRGLIVKTVGVADVVRDALAGLADRIDAAFVYGSFASGQETAESDVDVMVIGDVEFAQITSALRPVEDRLRREVNPSVFSTEEFRDRATKGEHFVSSILRGPKIMLIGSEDGLRAMA